MGLVEGYNRIGFDRSLSKPHLRREVGIWIRSETDHQMEHRMQLVCDGQQTKNDVLQFSIDQYKEVFIKARREFAIVVEA